MAVSEAELAALTGNLVAIDSTNPDLVPGGAGEAAIACFVEERRRSKVIPHFFDERSCLKLVFATLWRASQRWRGVRFTEMEKKQLEAYIRVRQAMGKKVRDLQAA